LQAGRADAAEIERDLKNAPRFFGRVDRARDPEDIVSAL